MITSWSPRTPKIPKNSNRDHFMNKKTAKIVFQMGTYALPIMSILDYLTYFNTILTCWLMLQLQEISCYVFRIVHEKNNAQNGHWPVNCQWLAGELAVIGRANFWLASHRPLTGQLQANPRPPTGQSVGAGFFKTGHISYIMYLDSVWFHIK